jgi:MFS family permease
MNKIIKFLKPGSDLSRKDLFLLYILTLGFLGLVEGVMSYYFPIQLERTFGTNLSAGLVIGLVNIVALICDFLIPELFKKRSWKFLLLVSVFFQMGYPGFTQLSVIFGFSSLLIVAAIFWNIYFEFMAFSRQSFIISIEKKDDYSRDWSIIAVIMGVTSIIGPILGSYVVTNSKEGGVLILAVLQWLALLSVITLTFIAPVADIPGKLQHHRHIKWSILKEFKIWEILGHRILPVILLGSMLTIISSAVSTVGGLMGEQMMGGDSSGWILLVIFNIPLIFVSLILSRIRVKKFKKKISQICLGFSGIFLFFLPFIKDNNWGVIICFFLASIFISISWILNEAEFSELSRRSGENKLYINSMERINDSLGFMLGPILIGFLADKLGYYIAFEIIGLLTIMIAIILFLITPKRILMPHK